MQCSAVQCSAVQCSAVQCSAAGRYPRPSSELILKFGGGQSLSLAWHLLHNPCSVAQQLLAVTSFSVLVQINDNVLIVVGAAVILAKDGRLHTMI